MRVEDPVWYGPDTNPTLPSRQNCLRIKGVKISTIENKSFFMAEICDPCVNGRIASWGGEVGVVEVIPLNPNLYTSLWGFRTVQTISDPNHC